MKRGEIRPNFSKVSDPGLGRVDEGLHVFFYKTIFTRLDLNNPAQVIGLLDLVVILQQADVTRLKVLMSLYLLQGVVGQETREDLPEPEILPNF